MALSERERHELARLEEQLTTEDPKLAGAFSGDILRNPSKRPLVSSLVLIAIGIVVVIAGVAATAFILSLAGVVVGSRRNNVVDLGLVHLTLLDVRGSASPLSRGPTASGPAEISASSH